MGTAMFIKSALAMLITIGFAGGAVYYGTKDIAAASNEVELRAPEKVTHKSNDNADETASEKIAAIVVPLDEPALEKSNESERKLVSEPEEINQSEPLPEPEPTLNLVEIMPLIMKQIDKMVNLETKDQAYYDVVSFSISQKQYNFADAAMRNIDQIVLRDTARSKIAVGLALDGRADDAFEVIDAVETEPLRDAMRLQVIEALIAPEKLPKGLGYR